MSRTAWMALGVALLGATATAHAQDEGWKCVRTTDRLCWACADVTFPFNRLCPDPENPCDADRVCVRRLGDLCPVCFEPLLDCCETLPCDRPPSCEGLGLVSACSGDTCTYSGRCAARATPFEVMCLPDGGLVNADAGAPDAGAMGEDAGPGEDAGTALDAGAAPMDAAVVPPFDAGSPPRAPRFGGGAGCRCGAAPRDRGAPLALLLPLMAWALRRSPRRGDRYTNASGDGGAP